MTDIVRCPKCDSENVIFSKKRGAYVCEDCNHCLMNQLLSLENLLKNTVIEKGDAELIKGFRKIKLIGKDWMGEEWLVEEETTGNKMGLKLIRPMVPLNAKNRDKFLQEAKLYGKLHHPNIIELYKTGYSADAIFLLMEFCEGDNLDKLIKKHDGILIPEIAVPIIIQVLNGLEYAHNVKIQVELDGGTSKLTEGLVHRSLSPQNILLSDSSERPTAKLGYFGIAKAFETVGLTGITRTGEASGKPVFMPRQQLINYKYSKPDVDVWAAAASLYNMLTGAFPKEFPPGSDVWLSALKGQSVPIRKRNPEIPLKLAAAIDQALIDNPEIKVKTASEFKQMLEESTLAPYGKL